jgi:two-component system phosphate regulon sensor histidine kinase PhoR
MDVEALEWLDEYYMATDDSVISSLNQQVFQDYLILLKSQERISLYLKVYLKHLGLDTDFNTGFHIHEISLMDPDDMYPVFAEKEGQKEKFEKEWIKEGALHVTSFNIEGNYFHISFDYYVDFSHKTKIIFRELAFAFLLALLSIIIAGLVFSFTIINMLKHRKLSEMKTDFINNLTHELRTPLTTISVAASSLTEQSVWQDKKQIVSLSEVIKSQNKQLSMLIERILDVNMWERDQIKLKPENVRMDEFLRNSMEGFKLENSDKKFKLTEDIQVNGCSAKIDSFQFNIAIHNLLSNALKYGGEPAYIEVKARCDQKSFNIRIRDNGMGISREEQKQLFQKFFRGRRYRKNVKGLGLGLFYVKKIVEMHGGTVEVESKWNRGSIFILNLPL